MNRLVTEALSLHKDLHETGTVNHPEDYQKTRESIYLLIIDLYRSSMAENVNARTGYLFTSLVHLDRVEFELKALDLPEGWKDLDFIFREISALRRSIYMLILSLKG